MNEYSGKRVLVMGLGLHGGGVETVRFLIKRGAQVTVTDLRSEKNLQSSLKKLRSFKKIRYCLGQHKKSDILASDLIVKNPGVPPTSPYIAYARAHKIPITTDMGIFFRDSRATIIGVTGTRGKSTTAFLIWKFLSTIRKNVFLGGNIRKSVLEFLPEVKTNDLVVLELSSFQLQDLAGDKKSPHIAVVTNIYRDHLNWHASMQEYIKAKKVIIQFQNSHDYVFANPEDSVVQKMVQKSKAHVVFPTLPSEFESVVDENLGEHYRSSIALAVAVASHFKVSLGKVRKILKEFNGLEGRQQLVGSIKNIHFVNDTTATIPDATVAAILRFSKKIGTAKLILIGGGQDKNLVFTELIKAITCYVALVVLLPGTATEEIKKGLQGSRVSILEVSSMHEAVFQAYHHAKERDWIILSPGATSFGLFLNEFDRGDYFMKAFADLKKAEKGR